MERVVKIESKNGERVYYIFWKYKLGATRRARVLTKHKNGRGEE